MAATFLGCDDARGLCVFLPVFFLWTSSLTR